MNVKNRHLIPVAAMTVLLASCGGSEVQIDDGSSGTSGNGATGNSGTEAGAINLVGLLKMEPVGSDGEDSTRALFGRLDTALSAQAVRNFYVPGEDTCEVTPLDTDAEATSPQLTVADQLATLVSAGETIVISSDAGTYSTLVQESGDNGVFYTPEAVITTAAPAGLVVDVPGDEYPAFNLSVQSVPVLALTAPAADETVNADTVYSWNANDVSGSVFEVSLAGMTADGQEIEISCTASDDGSFTFPESVKTQMGADFEAYWSSQLRIAYTVAQQGGALFFTANSAASQ